MPNTEDVPRKLAGLAWLVVCVLIIYGLATVVAQGPVPANGAVVMAIGLGAFGLFYAGYYAHLGMKHEQ